MELKNRERKVDLSKMEASQVDQISLQLGDMIRQICDDAVAKANRLLNVYGMNAKMQIVIEHPEMKGKQEVQKKRGRPKKASQSLT